MNVSFKFIAGLAAGIALGIALFLALLYTQLGVPTYSSSWAYDIGQKKRAIAAIISGPRLLLVGGSSTTFGLSARIIERDTGAKTVNMGTHAGWGADYLLDWAERTARPGDTVLLALEYQLYVSEHNSEPHDDYILARDSAYFRRMAPWDKIDMATRVAWKRIQKGLNIRRHGESAPRPHPPYTDGASYIDAWGDNTGNTTVDPRKPEATEIVAPLITGINSTDASGFDAVRRFVAWARAHNVKVLATFPAIVQRPDYNGPNAKEAADAITKFYASLNVPVVGTATDAIFPPDQFFEMPYHLTRAGAVARTEKLVPALKPYLR